jgi:hypothetical protein
MVLLTESKETISFRDLGHRVADNLCFSKTVILFGEEAEEDGVVDVLIEVADINLVVTLGCRLHTVGVVVVLGRLLRRLLLQLVQLVLGTVTGPIELKTTLGARDIGPIQILVNIFGDFVVGKLDEAIANGGVLYFITDQLD